MLNQRLMKSGRGLCLTLGPRLRKAHRGGNAIPTGHASQMRELRRLEHKRCSKMHQVQFPVQLLHLVSRRRFPCRVPSRRSIRHRHRCHGFSGDNWSYGHHLEWLGTPMDNIAYRRVYPRCSSPLQVQRPTDANWRIRPIFEEGLVVIEAVVSIALREMRSKGV